MSENKGDLISRSALGVGPRNPEQFVDPERARGWNDLLEIINVAPTVDAVEVVRCKDCLHFEKGDSMGAMKAGDPLVCYGKCSLLILGMLENGFCCFGKRKDGADSGKAD